MKSDIQLGYYIHSGVNAMLKHKALTLTSIATTTACLLLISSYNMICRPFCKCVCLVHLLD